MDNKNNNFSNDTIHILEHNFQSNVVIKVDRNGKRLLIKDCKTKLVNYRL